MTGIIVRRAGVDDAAGVAAVLQALADAGKRRKPSDPGFALRHYIAHPDQVACHVAMAGTETLGFQSVKRARSGNPYGTPPGWGIMGTHVDPGAARRGAGRLLFAATVAAARAAGLIRLEAFFGGTNDEGLAFYEAMGFRTWRHAGSAVAKMLPLD